MRPTTMPSSIANEEAVNTLKRKGGVVKELAASVTEIGPFDDQTQGLDAGDACRS